MHWENLQHRIPYFLTRWPQNVAYDRGIRNVRPEVASNLIHKVERAKVLTHEQVIFQPSGSSQNVGEHRIYHTKETDGKVPA